MKAVREGACLGIPSMTAHRYPFRDGPRTPNQFPSRWNADHVGPEAFVMTLSGGLLYSA